MTEDDDPAAADPARPERLLADLAALAIAILCVVITVTIVSRWLYRGIVPDDVLIVRELMVVVILLPLAAVSAKRAQIAVTIFTKGIKGRGAAALSAFGHLAGALFIGALLAAGARMFLGSWASGDYYDGDLYIPMWLAHGMYTLGLGAFLVRLIANMIADLRTVARG
jgi:TRAP-type C4-dicarboxylate transport system permease small subunit